METETKEANPSWVRSRLPWLVALGAMVFYFFTLNWWLTLPGLGVLPRAAGWDWEPTYGAPLLFLINYPVRWLPASWHLPVLNLIPCVCSALTLALLARSVALLPHDRTRDQRQLERDEYSFLSIRFNWFPPLVAVLVCALQYSFWQHSIVNTGEALDLLCFAYIIRCLLESRIDERDSWLVKMALVCGLSITNNFAMIGFLPLLLGALIWIKGTRLLNPGLIIQIVLAGLAGLLLYFLLPTVDVLSGRVEESFWEILRINLGNQRQFLSGVPRYVMVLVALTSLLPVIFVGIRWPAQFGDISAAGNALTNLMTHVIHGVFLLECLLVAFDPAFSPRRLADNRQMLPFYYLGALSIGYFVGYFMLVFGQRPKVVKSWQRPSPLRQLINYVVVGVVCLASIGVPAALFVQNRPEILLMSRHDLQKMGDLMAESLPREPSVILTDDPNRLYALEAALEKRGGADRYVLVHTSSLSLPAYHRFLHQRYGKTWPRIAAERPLEQRVDPSENVTTVTEVAQGRRLFYLHPSFGYYFEFFYAIPEKMVFELHPYATNEVEGRKMTVEEVNQNLKFWTEQEEALAPLRMQTDLEKVAKRPPEGVLFLISSMYSRTINAVGVAMQQAGFLKEAGILFTNALSLNAYNPYAFINQEFNRKLQAGQGDLSADTPGVRDRLARYKFNFNAILNENGPVDEPVNCYILADVLARGRNYRQAAQQLLRTLHYHPDNFQAEIGVATMLVRAGMTEKGLESLQSIRERYPNRNLEEQMAEIKAEAWALAQEGKKRPDKLAEAIALLQKAQSDHPDQPTPFASLAEIYLDANQITNAIEVFEKQIAAQPKNNAAKINYYALLIQSGNFDQAIDGLTRYLAENPTDERGRLNRAIAYFLKGDMDKAEADYRALYDAGSPGYPVYYGLGEINFRRGNKREAKSYYEYYLTKAPRDTPEYRQIEERLKLLRRGLF